MFFSTIDCSFAYSSCCRILTSLHMMSWIRCCCCFHCCFHCCRCWNCCCPHRLFHLLWVPCLFDASNDRVGDEIGAPTSVTSQCRWCLVGGQFDCLIAGHKVVTDAVLRKLKGGVFILIVRWVDPPEPPRRAESLAATRASSDPKHAICPFCSLTSS